MLFTDTSFLFYFLPLSLLLHRIALAASRQKVYPTGARLVIFSLTLVFYGWREPWWLVPFVGCLSADYLLAWLLAREDRPGRRKSILIVSVLQNIAVLTTFKYWEFIVRNVGRLSPEVASWLPRITQDGQPLDLPPAISFYVFESLSFVIDVYRRQVHPPRSPLEFFAFIGMFPRFMAGPIVRYREMVSQFDRYVGMRLEQGLFLFIWGLFLKCVFADSFALFVPCAFDKWEDLSFLGAWIGVIAYTMQIYFDFSGYSLMAMGLGRCFGFTFPVNFNRPYLAGSVQDFWRRWHMSLSSWLRDYLYIPLGGSRRGTGRTYFNLFLTMLIGGVWHGAQWTFVFWGAWHGAALCLERALGLDRRTRARVGWLYTAVVVLVGWVFFRANGLRHAGLILRRLIDPRSAAEGFNFEIIWGNSLSLVLCGVGLFHCFFLEKRIDPLLWEREPPVRWPERSLAAAALLVTLALMLSHPGTIPFLYYQF